MSTVVGLNYILHAPEDAIFFVPELGVIVKKKFAVFHHFMGRCVAVRNVQR